MLVDPYKRQFGDWSLERMAKTLKEVLRLESDPVAVGWSMEPPFGTTSYEGSLRIVPCESIQRSRFHRETFVVNAETVSQICPGYTYHGLGVADTALKSGNQWSRREDGKPAIYGSPGAGRRVKEKYRFIEPGTADYFSCAPLSSGAFDPDVVIIIADPRTLMYAARAAIHYRGGIVSGVTGPGTCCSTWIASYLTGEIRYSLGCFGVFGFMGIDPSELVLSLPIEWLPETCSNLKEWKERGLPIFKEGPPNEDRPFMKAPYEGPYDEIKFWKPE